MFLGSLYDSEVVIIVADFTEGQEVFTGIAEKLKDFEVGILINNVGLSYIHPDYFLEVSKEVSTFDSENCRTLVLGFSVIVKLLS